MKEICHKDTLMFTAISLITHCDPWVIGQVYLDICIKSILPPPCPEFSRWAKSFQSKPGSSRGKIFFFFKCIRHLCPCVTNLCGAALLLHAQVGCCARTGLVKHLLLRTLSTARVGDTKGSPLLGSLSHSQGTAAQTFYGLIPGRLPVYGIRINFACSSPSCIN